MGNERQTAETPDGDVEYTVYICDWCGKRSTENFGLHTGRLFNEYRWLFSQHEYNEKFNQSACTTQCFESLLKIALSDFYRAWNKEKS